MNGLICAWGEYVWLAEILSDRLGGVPVTQWNVEHSSHFSHLLRQELIGRRERVLYITPADQFPIGEVPDLDNYEWYIARETNVLRLGVTTDPAMAEHGTKVGTYKGIRMLECKEWQHCSHAGGMGMDAALWNRALLASLLEPGKTMDQISVQGSERMHLERPDLRSVALDPPLFQSVKIVDAAVPRTVSRLDMLDPVDAESIRSALPGNWREA